jgi:hypothetical protein
MTPRLTPKQIALFAAGFAAVLGVIVGVLVVRSTPEQGGGGQRGSSLVGVFIAFLPILIIMINRNRNR